MFFVYVLFSESHLRFYTGMTINLERRLKEHNSKKNKSTKAFVPWKMVFFEEFTTRKEARIGEKYLKSGVGREYVKSTFNRLRSSTG